ncbi:hypothetical protein Acr_13g0006750 [Actinidia rufa]|uniref:Uncharacterized protein n=1 Tax=Actinidia rufa TaxID=165716 RepID=A0A7J0FKP4_9ERIC|nr:hypothetical protein Acr_13g0006750 [Actinidia rufa]
MPLLSLSHFILLQWDPLTLDEANDNKIDNVFEPFEEHLELQIPVKEAYRCNSGGFWRLERVFRLAADLGWEVLAGVVVVMGYPVDFCWYQLVIDLGGSGHLPVSLVAVVDGRLLTIVMVVSGVCRCGGRVY